MAPRLNACKHLRSWCEPLRINRKFTSVAPSLAGRVGSTSDGLSEPSLATTSVDSSMEHSLVPTHTDALIIGGGPAGVAVALMLAAHGNKVTVCERNSTLTHADPDRRLGLGQQA